MTQKNAGSTGAAGRATNASGLEPTVAARTDAVANAEPGVLYVGVDFGTSKTAISASNGVRAKVDSVVGYPRDVVSRKLLKKDVLFGREALENRLSLNLYRPLANGMIKYSDEPKSAKEEEIRRNMEAARALIKHAVSLAGPKPGELVYGVIGCPAQASIKNKQSIIDVAREVLDSVVICSEPFSVAYGLDMLTDCLVIDIGAGTTDLCRMKGAMPDETDQVTFSQAGDFLDQEIFRLFRDKCAGAQFTVNMVKDIKERYAFVGDAPEPVVVEFPVDGKPQRFDVTDELRRGCRTIVPPIIDSVSKLIATFDPEFQRKLRSNVLLAGGGSQIIGLGRAVEEALDELGGGTVYTVEEPTYAGANGALKIAYDMPAETWEQLR